jgi:hypothetical protein
MHGACQASHFFTVSLGTIGMQTAHGCKWFEVQFLNKLMRGVSDMLHLLNKKMLCIAVWGFTVASVGFADEGSTLGADIKDTAKKAAVSVTKTAFDAVDKRDLSMSFDPGVTALTEGQKIELSALVKSLDASPKKLKLSVAAWSDLGYPSAAKEKLSTKDEILAENRLAAVTSYVQGLAKFAKTETVNMAKRSNAFERFFSSDESKVKAAFAGVETKEPWVAYQANTFRAKGGAGKAVVVIYDMTENFSH